MTTENPTTEALVTSPAPEKVAAKAPAKAQSKPAAKPATEVAAKAKPITKAITKAIAKPVVEPTTAPAVKAKPATKAAAKPAEKPAAKSVSKSVAKSVPQVAPVKATKAKKPKMVRDSFTFPKDEYTVLDELKLRAAKLGHPIKKTELLRAGVKAIAAMADAALLAALQSVPSLKTGRPAKGN